ncbi:MAG: patatin family protein [Treponema sp.]|nr:patatin family protein [Treponema sp.]
MKKGLVLEGGALRVIFSCGVLDVLMENGIDFDGMMTVSAGACFGCNFKSRQVGRAVRFNMKYASDKRYCSWRSFLKTGNLFNAEFAYHTIPEKLDIFDFDMFRKNPIEFYIAATNIRTGNAEFKKFDECDERCLEFIRASAAMPLVQRIVDFDGEKYLDGGIADSIPLKKFEELGFEKNLVILTQPKDFVKKPNPLLPLIRLRYRKYPNLIQTVKNRHLVYNDETKYVFDRAKQNACFVICPSENLGISRAEKNPAELKRIYEMGRKICMKNLPEIKKFFLI